MSINHIVLEGNVGQEPKLRTFNNDDNTTTIVVDISVAQNLSDPKDPSWWQVRFRSKMSENPEKYLSLAERALETIKKGDHVIITGKMNDYKSEAKGRVKFIDAEQYRIVPRLARDEAPPVEKTEEKAPF